jgi:hypothetical protein
MLSYGRWFGRVLCGGGALMGVLGSGPAATRPTTRPASPATRPSSILTEIPSPEVDSLISQLADPHWQVRNRAADRLAQLGSPVERQLERARDAARTVDLRTRLELVLSRIDEGRRAGTSYVSLHLKAASVHDALAALEREARVKFDAGSGELGDGGSITLDADHRPFWLVLRDLCAQAKVEVGSIDSSGRIVLRGGDEEWGRRPCAIKGPYMLLARRIELTRTLDLANPKAVTNAYSLVLLAYAEPKLRPIYWSVRGIDQCVTDTGRMMDLPNDAFEPGDLNADSETRLQFTGPAEVGHRLAKLRLSARFVLSERSDPVEIGGILKVKNDSQTVGGWRVLIKGVAKGDDDRYAAAVSVYRDNHTPEEWSERMGLLDRAQPRLIDASGKPMESGGMSLNEGPDEWNWTDEFTPGTPEAKPAKLVWDFPLETRHVDVSFEFKDLPLP